MLSSFLTLQESDFVGHTDGAQAAITATDGYFTLEWWRWGIQQRNAHCQFDGRFCFRTQFRREVNLDTLARAKVENVTVGNGDAREPLFQAHGLRTELDVIVDPFALFAMLILYRDGYALCFFHNIGKTRQVQGFTVQVKMVDAYFPLVRDMLPRLISAFVQEHALQDELVPQHVALDNFRVTAARAVFDGIELGEGHRLWHFSHTVTPLLDFASSSSMDTGAGAKLIQRA